MKKKQAAGLALVVPMAAVITGCALFRSGESAEVGAPVGTRPAPPSASVECTPDRLPGRYSGISTGNLILAAGQKPLLSQALSSKQAASVESRGGSFVLRLEGGPIPCDLTFSCASPSLAQMDPDQQCVFNFSDLSPANSEDIVFELLKGEASVSGGGANIRLEWKAKSRREYDRAAGRLRIDLAVGRMDHDLKLQKR